MDGNDWFSMQIIPNNLLLKNVKAWDEHTEDETATNGAEHNQRSVPKQSPESSDSLPPKADFA